MNVDEFRQLPIMGILRGAEADVIEPLTEAVVASGLRTIEITMNTRNAPEMIHRMAAAADGRLNIGAGTVLTMDELHRALDAGATFIVSPTLAGDVVEYCVTNAIPVFPGAFTPQEIFNAWRAGATMVKVFPAKLLGPTYFQELKGPFQDIELLACGGITTDSINSYFASGASAVAFGGSIFKNHWLQTRQFAQIESAIRSLIQGFVPERIELN